MNKILLGGVVNESGSAGGRSAAVAPNSVQFPGRGRAPALDRVDRAILEQLAHDARMPNNALAAAVGVAPSTCLGRVRALRDAGVIRGFHADVDPAAIGRPIQAMVAVRVQGHARAQIAEFATTIAAAPEVLDVFFLAGADDFLVHVAARDTADLREFVVVNLSGHPGVALTETNLIFQHVRSSLHR